jgi:hypothetical protein
MEEVASVRIAVSRKWLMEEEPFSLTLNIRD